MFEIIKLLLIDFINIFPYLIVLYFIFDIVGSMILGNKR